MEFIRSKNIIKKTGRNQKRREKQGGFRNMKRNRENLGIWREKKRGFVNIVKKGRVWKYKDKKK